MENKIVSRRVDSPLGYIEEWVCLASLPDQRSLLLPPAQFVHTCGQRDKHVAAYAQLSRGPTLTVCQVKFDTALFFPGELLSLSLLFL